MVILPSHTDIGDGCPMFVDRWMKDWTSRQTVNSLSPHIPQVKMMQSKASGWPQPHLATNNLAYNLIHLLSPRLYPPISLTSFPRCPIWSSLLGGLAGMQPGQTMWQLMHLKSSSFSSASSGTESRWHCGHVPHPFACWFLLNEAACDSETTTTLIVGNTIY
jgi:hypothetical protein